MGKVLLLGCCCLAALSSHFPEPIVSPKEEDRSCQPEAQHVEMHLKLHQLQVLLHVLFSPVARPAHGLLLHLFPSLGDAPVVPAQLGLQTPADMQSLLAGFVAASREELLVPQREKYHCQSHGLRLLFKKLLSASMSCPNA